MGSKLPAMKGRLFTIGLISSWYFSNIGVLLLNKYLLSNYGFKYPIFLTMCHMTACALLSYIGIVWLKLVPMQTIRSRSQLMKIAALSVIFSTSVVGGNISLRFLPVSFNQAVGATTPFFTALFAYLVTFKREAWITYATLVPVVAGVVIASGGEPSFHLYGFIMCIGATAARALKSVLQGILLSSEGEKLNSMNLLLYMAPIAVLVLLPAALIMEPNVMSICVALTRQDKFMAFLLIVNSAMAYFVNLTNFLVTKHTSALTLQKQSTEQRLMQVRKPCGFDISFQSLDSSSSIRPPSSATIRVPSSLPKTQFNINATNTSSYTCTSLESSFIIELLKCSSALQMIKLQTFSQNLL